MPNWKKVIVSGSNASLNSITASNGAVITGSVNISGSTTQIGSNNLLGNTTLSGSIIISGAFGTNDPTVRVYGDITHDGYVRFNPVSTNINNSISASYIYVSGSTNDLYFTQNGKGYGNTTRLRWLEGNLYTGLLNGGVITSQSSTTYQISSGSGIIVNLNASLNDNPYPVVQYLNWPNLSASIAPLTASYQQAFVGIDSTNNIFAQGTPFSNGQFDTIINIGNVLFQNQSTINGVKTQPSVAYGFEQQQNVFNRAFGPLKLSGYTLAPSGSSTGSLIVGSGTAYAPGSNYIVDPNEPYYTVDNGTNVSKIFRYRQSGSTWVYDTNGGAGYTVVDPTKYSNNGTLTTVPTGPGADWSIQRVFWFPNSVTKAIVVYYGNAVYNTEADARGNIDFESFVEAPNTAANAIYLGAIILRGDFQNWTQTDRFTIYPGGLFRQVGGSGGGGSVVTQTLSGLSDVQISGQTNLQPLVYSTTAGKWINSSSISGSLIGNASTATTASYALSATSASYALTASNVEGGTQYYVPLWNTGTSLTNSYLNQSGSVLKTIFSGQDRGLTLDYNTNSFILGNAGTGNNTYFQVFDGGSTINVYSRNYTYFNDKVGVRIIPTNPGFAVSGALEVTGPGTSKFMNSNVQITGSLNVNAGITGSLLGTGSYAENSNLLDGNDSSVFATTGSNTFKSSQTIDGNIFLSGSNRLIYNNSNTNSLLFGFFDGGSIYGPYYQIFGNNYADTTQRGSAEFVFDTRNAGGSGFNIASFNGSTWTRRFRVDDNGAQVTGSLIATGDIITQGNIVAQQYIISSSVAYFTESFSSGSTRFGNSQDDTHQFTGSVNITGSLNVYNGEIFAGRIDNTNEGGQVSFARALDGVNGWYIDVYGNTSTPSLRFIDVSTAAVRMTISGSGGITMGQSLAVGSINPSATVGRIDASNDVVAFSTSDIGFKENIQPIDNALNKIDLIGGYTFDWKSDPELKELHGFEGHDVGVIAQEIESILPEIVTTRDNGYKAVKYEKIVPLLIQAIKELKAEVDSLKAGNYNKWD